ncbi:MULTISPECIES: hypothetical protein [Metabacillus]|uniref:hypothetical protein n=1 Tax=Metabacillus TaxID=2675233 RepID=UPI000C810595|nr:MULTISPECIES: hypothetical protein [Metabacillus]MCM3443581.1 hypothetical protein [Metabacillus halosaccharovorans]PMC34258.1 hypothetical protein CJ195_24385 [Bacillus sp. UMB0899]
MKKLVVLLGLIMALSIGGASVSAAEKTISEDKVDKFLKKAGAPDELLERWEYDQKLDLYNKGKDNLIEFDTTKEEEFVRVANTGELVESDSVEQPSGEFTTMGTISKDKLKVSHDIWSMYSGGVKYKSVYANYEWVNPNSGTKGDKLAIAVPSGWAIKAGSYECKEFQSGWPANGYSYKANCGGGTYDLDFYGAVWSLTRTDNVWHKGWSSLDMKRTKTSAQLRVLSKYIEDSGGSTSWSIGWGPMSVSISGNKSSNQIAWDTGFSY